MTTINDKLGLKRAGKRSMMKNLPEDRALGNNILDSPASLGNNGEAWQIQLFGLSRQSAQRAS